MPPKCEAPHIGEASRNSCGGCFRDPLNPLSNQTQFLFAAHKIHPELVAVAAPAFSEALMMHETGLASIARYYDGQHYLFVGLAPHTKRDGEETVLARWASNCADCGQPFACSTVAGLMKFGPTRRCQLCKKPGVRVRRPISAIGNASAAK